MDAWCFKEKSARKRTARGVDSDVSAARRGGMGSDFGVGSLELSSLLVVMEVVFVDVEKLATACGYVAVGAMIVRLQRMDESFVERRERSFRI